MLVLNAFPINHGVRTGGQHAAPAILEPFLLHLGAELGLPIRKGQTVTPVAHTEDARSRFGVYADIALCPGALSFALGGDHTITYAHMASVAHAPAGVLWIDAHGDFNTPESSLTGNAHGMVLAALCGAISGVRPYVDPHQTVVWGVRDLDPGERERMESYGVQLVSAKADADTLAWLDRHLADEIYLSLDVDALDPAYAPATGTPVPSGFEPDGLGKALARLLQGRRVIGVDLVEFDPLLPGSRITLRNLKRLLKWILPVLASSSHLRGQVREKER